jgi:putative DNA primase/helicase
MPLTARLDAHPYLLNCQNGTVDLRTGTLLEHDRGHFLSKIVAYDYVESALCPRFLGTLDRSFPDNPEGIKFIQKTFGYSLTGDVSEKKIFIFWGATGNNGKTLLFNVIRGILGSCFCIQLASESLVSGRMNAIRSDIAKLIGYRFVTASETDKKYKFNEALIKLLTGGDAITARHPHEREIEFTPELKLFLGTNAKPEFTLSDRAMMSRVCIIPFHVSIPPHEQDKQLTQRLIAEEAEGILAWAIEGARLWAEEGLGENPFDQDSAAVINPVITIDQFVKECCVMDPGARAKSSDLLQAFNNFKERRGDESPTVNDKAFGGMLNGLNLEKTHGRDGNYREGIALNELGRKFFEGVEESDLSEEDTTDIKTEEEAQVGHE